MMQFKSTTEFLDTVRTYCETSLAHHAAQIDQSDTIPERVYAELIERRLFAFDALTDGGQVFSSPERIGIMLQCLATLAETSPTVAKAVMDQNFGQVEMMREFGNKTIHAKLDNIRAGREQAAFLMAEPHAGSDPSQFETRYERATHGVFISGVKDWITGAARREYFVTLAKDAGGCGHFGLFLIDREACSGGIRITDRKSNLGLRGLGEYRVELDKVYVPNDHVVMAPSPDTMDKVMRHHSIKCCGQAAICVGTTQAALRAAHGYLQDRFPGGILFQNTQFTFADLYSRAVATRSLHYSAAMETLAGDTSGVPASIAKYVCTELAVEATSKLAQLCGGNGLCDKLPLERQMRDMRMLTVAGGASQMLQATIARHMERLLQPPACTL